MLPMNARLALERDELFLDEIRRDAIKLELFA